MRKIELYLTAFLSLFLIPAGLYTADLQTGEGNAFPEQPQERAEYMLHKSAELAKTDGAAARSWAREAEKTVLEHGLNLLHPVYFQLSASYYYHEGYDSAMYYIRRALEYEAPSPEWNFRAESYLFLGNMSVNRGREIGQTLEYYNLSLTEAAKLQNERIMGAAYSAAGNLFRVNGGYAKALEYILQAKEHYGHAGFEEGIAWIDFLLGRLYGSMDLYSEAISYSKLSLEKYREIAAGDGVMNGVSMALEQLSLLQVENGEYDAALISNMEAEKIYRENSRKYGLAGTILTSAKIFHSRGDSDTALKSLARSQQIKREINNTYALTFGFILYGEIFNDLGRYKEGIDSLLIALSLAKQMDQAGEKLIIYKELADIYEHLGQETEALRYLKAERMLDDSLSTLENIRKMTQMLNLEALDRKDAQIQILEKSRTINELTLRAAERERQRNILAIAALLFIIAGISALYLFKRKAFIVEQAQALKIEKQRKLLASKNSELEKTNHQLSEAKDKAEKALAEVRTLSGLLPICSSCKKIRDDSGYWNQLEVYITDHSHADFTHGICPDCARDLYPDIFRDSEKRISKSNK